MVRTRVSLISLFERARYLTKVGALDSAMSHGNNADKKTGCKQLILVLFESVNLLSTGTRQGRWVSALYHGSSILDKMSRIEKVFPTEEELSIISSQVQCSVENCSAIFKSTSNLNMHLIRHHKVSGEELCRKEAVRQFYCPAKLCIYNKDSNKYFKKLKYLKQHFLKVHAAKTFICNKCDKRFATEAFKKMHAKNCGSLFQCACGFSYNSIEALLTHCRRKGHTSLNPNCGKCEKISTKKEICENNVTKKPERFICPKLSTDVAYPTRHIAAIALSELSTPNTLSRLMEKGVQTDFNKSTSWKDFKRSSSKMQRKQNNSQQTQTMGRSKNLKINTETQTSSEYLKSKLKSPSKSTLSKKRKKSMETQTKDLLNGMCSDDHKTYKSDLSCCTSIETEKSEKFFNTDIMVDNLFHDVSPGGFLKVGANNLSNENNHCTQEGDLRDMSEKSLIDSDELFNRSCKIAMSPEPSSKQDLFNGNTELNICSKEFEADFSELNMSCKKFNNENESLYLMESGTYNMFDINKLCNIETQTEIDNILTECNDDSSFTLCSTTETQTMDFDPLLYSNMCTQTCDEVNHLFNFNFVDIETQTAWPVL